MSAFNPRIFTNPGRLKEINPALLAAFFKNWISYFAGRGVNLTALKVEEFPFDDIARILANPDASVPDDMVNALYYVDETATPEAMCEILEQAEKDGLALDSAIATTPADVAIQVWLVRPELLEMQHAETTAFKRTTFTYFAGKSGMDAKLPESGKTNIAEMEARLDDWFETKRRGRGSRVFSFERGPKVWFLIRHGQPMKREGAHQDDGNSGIAYYRPEQHDVLIYDSELDDIAINTSTKGERELYLTAFGTVFFDDGDYFSTSERFSLTPLPDFGPDVMNAEDIAGIDCVRLIEFGREWPGKFSRREIQRSTDLFGAFGENWRKWLSGGRITHAKFRVAFDGNKKERSVLIRPANIARYERGEDEQIIEAWLKARGICKSVAEDAEDANFEVLDCA